MTRRPPWPAGAATGIGSLPGIDVAEATRLVFGELPELPHLPELPARGAGADMIGRAAALLVDLPVEIAPSGWRLTARPGRDLRVARDFLDRDLDALEHVGGEFTGAVKIQVAGPWTLAASIELPSGHRVVSDHGATRDLAESLADGLGRHLADVQRRLPRASVVVQLDEPSLPSVLNGHVPTPSGWGTVRAVAANDVEQTLGQVLSVAPAGARLVHCCASDAPISLFIAAGADAVAIDSTRLESRSFDALGEAIEAGIVILLGVVPGIDSDIAVEGVIGRVEGLWQALGFPRAQLPEAIVATTACGLAGATPDYVRRAMSVLRDASLRLSEESE